MGGPVEASLEFDVVGEILFPVPGRRPVGAYAARVLPEGLAGLEARDPASFPVSARVVRAFRRVYCCPIASEERADGIAVHDGTIS